ncbi:MAG: tyrosine-type recombinase/integrase [Cellulosilyticaceae bacterium]
MPNFNETTKKSNEELINAAVTEMKYYGVAANTIKNVVSTTNKLVDKTGKNLLDIKMRDVKDWLAYLLNEKNLKASTVNTNKNYISTFYKYLMSTELTETNPALAIPNVVEKNKQEKVILDKKEIKQTFKEMSSIIHTEGDWILARDIVVLKIACNTGMRESELGEIKIEDINFENGEVILTNTKNGKNRPVYFNDEIIKLIKKYLSVRVVESEYLICNRFGEQIRNSKTWNEILRKYCNKEGVTFHSLRHSAATIMIENGSELIDVSSALGHSSVDITYRTYIKTDKEKTEKTMKRLNL